MTISVTIEDIQAAAERIESVVVRTPLIRHPELDAAVGGVVLVKPENLQRSGSFKIRGAYNLLSQLSEESAANGVVAWSSGNHAQGVAAAGKMLGIHAAIVMPEDAPAAKIQRTRRYGGETILYDRHTGDREAIAQELIAERGAAPVPPYDHLHTIAGQGTVGLELMQQAAEMGFVPDQVLIPCGGGGLNAGCAVAIKDTSPSTMVHTVEPVEFDDTARSIAAGELQTIEVGSRSICDSLLAPAPGKLTFDINRQLAGEGLRVTDEEVCDAMRFACIHLKLVVEPGGAVGLAALLSGKVKAKGKTTAIVLSGGNVDTDLFSRIQNEA